VILRPEWNQDQVTSVFYFSIGLLFGHYSFNLGIAFALLGLMGSYQKGGGIQ
jgi:hypothetical protein